MPYRTYGLDEIARYLHLSRGDVEHLVKNQEIPFEKHGNRLVFQKVAIDSWASRRILGLEGKQLADYHQKSSRAVREVFKDQALLPDQLQPGFIDPALPAKTKGSVLREMALLAGRTGRVNDPEALLEELRFRENLCSTGLPGGVALLHPRRPESYMFDAPFIVLGRTVQQIPFGAPDGEATDLFFLIACPDDRMHLHVLARLCIMAHKTEILAELRLASCADAMFDAMVRAEREVLGPESDAGRSIE
ncbi:MAG TPA: PTS sugar transporter subunit IIA [Candidatus Paceibacterota bacterium]|nr:PTS sugar transporter subunit IIA [Verrucomicrobiota bacterium]HRZ44145.1 PTS sugar transporter subunit IIA [Candidatus Paceibacterota bacterium]HRZ91305.1 PTS sugar transporter subunit IIA [Candidatus Paceibacterota bacterium]